jgi:hypothetical protein
MKRDDFVFSIGYQGNTALIDSRTARHYSKLSAAQLSEQGLFRAAFRMALYDDDRDSMKLVVDAYNRVSGAHLEGIDDMKRLLGVFSVPEGVTKVSRI